MERKPCTDYGRWIISPDNYQEKQKEGEILSIKYKLKSAHAYNELLLLSKGQEYCKLRSILGWLPWLLLLKFHFKSSCR